MDDDDYHLWPDNDTLRASARWAVPTDESSRQLQPIDRKPMTDYSRIVRLMKARHRVRVRKWRRSMSGCAWRVSYRDGRSINWVEAPIPRTALSLAIFLHEIGHHAVGFEKFKKRCEEEYHVWQWAMDQMRRLGVEP